MLTFCKGAPKLSFDFDFDFFLGTKRNSIHVCLEYEAFTLTNVSQIGEYKMRQDPHA